LEDRGHFRNEKWIVGQGLICSGQHSLVENSASSKKREVKPMASNHFLITYHLSKFGQNYAAVTQRLREMGAYQILASQWIMTGEHDVKELRDLVVDCLGSDDRVLVSRVVEWATWPSIHSKAPNEVPQLRPAFSSRR
jgi:hypothetical protein